MLTKASYSLIEGAPYNVLDYGATGDGVTDDAAAIQAAISAAFAAGGGTVYFPSGIYFVSVPIQIQSSVNLEGANWNSTIIKKNSTTTVGGIDCVIYGNAKNRFTISNIGVDGLDTAGKTIADVHSIGFYLNTCSYFDITGSQARYCLNGYKFVTCYIFELAQATAQQSLQYGFVTDTSTTSAVFRNTTAWGCGGGWSLSSTIYSQLIGCACDHSDAGGNPSDPFLPFGSGGNYQNTNYIFRFIACQGITVISPGCENSYSQYIYAEGGYATIISPFVFNLQCYDTSWNFISTRFTGKSRVTIINPYNFETQVVNTLSPSSTIRGYYVENPANQQIEIVGATGIGSSFGDYAYSAQGLVSSNDNIICNYTQQSMVVGADSSFIYTATNVSNVQLTGSTKYLVFDAVTAAAVTFDQPLPTQACITINATGEYTSSTGVANLSVIETNGTTTNVLKSWTNNVNVISINDAFNVSATAGYSVFFRITTNATTDVMKFSDFRIRSMVNNF